MASYRELVQHSNEEIWSKWLTSGENEFWRLFRILPHNGIEGFGVLDWIKKSDVLRAKKVTYPRYTVNYRPEKNKPDQTGITCGGDVLDYFGDVTTHMASMKTIKIHWNLLLLTPGTKYCTVDISNMYLMSMLPEAEYVQFRYNLGKDKKHGMDCVRVAKSHMTTSLST